MRFPLAKAVVALALASFPSPVYAASLSLVPTSATDLVNDGDFVTFDILMDFAGEPTLGGAFDIVFESSALEFVSFFRDTNIGDPAESRDPDVLNGRLESWAVADFDGLPEVAVLGNVVFQVLPTMGDSTVVWMESTGICGCWIDASSFDPVYPDVIAATVSRVPLPGAIWFMLSGVGVLLGVRHLVPRGAAGDILPSPCSATRC